MRDLIGYGPHLEDIILQSLGREELIKKNQDIQTDKENGREGKA